MKSSKTADVVGMEVVKTKLSYCALPLTPQSEEDLLAEKKAKENETDNALRLLQKYTDYICVDAIGELIKTNYVTDHLKELLKEKGLRTVLFKTSKAAHKIFVNNNPSNNNRIFDCGAIQST